MSIADFPIALQPLFEPHRYKIAYGGRGGSKSWSIASYLALEAAKKPTRVLCCREFQASIRESVHRLLSDRIRSLGLAEKFDILDTAIRSKTGSGSEFIFEGLRHNAGKIRSLEAIDKVWVEEAANVSKTSWEILIPTIRKDGSEIIISFNPELETDETYQRFIARPPRDAVLMNSEDAAQLRLIQGDPIALTNDIGRFEGRVFLAPIARGNLQIHWPEGNVIIRRNVLDKKGGVPDYNARVTIERIARP